MWKSWCWPSLFYDFGEVSVKKTIFTVASCKNNVSSCPCRTFHFSLPPVRVFWWNQVNQKFCTLSMTCSQKQKHNFLFFLFPMRRSHIFLSVVVSCLQMKCHDCHLSLQMYQSRNAFCQLFSAGFVNIQARQWIYIDLHCAVQVC